jgi:hypothetical protein
LTGLGDFNIPMLLGSCVSAPLHLIREKLAEGL